MSSFNPEVTRSTLRTLRAQYQRGEKLTMLTAYDYVTAGLLDQAGIDLILVGDSLGNVVMGYDTTIPVTLDDMIHHCAAVVRGTRRTFVVCDLPFGITADPETALKASIQVFQKTGCQAVKIEGGAEVAPIVRRLVDQGIPVMAHIGLTPQSVHQMGGYYTHGKTESDVQRLRDSAKALQDAGAFSIVLECIYPEAAALIEKDLQIPTIGIGSGEQCSGQVLVINDLIGLSLRPGPKFAKPRANVAEIIRGAAREYIRDVRGEPAPEAPSPEKR